MSWYRFAWPDESWHFAIDGEGLALCGAGLPAACRAIVKLFREARAAGAFICGTCKARRQDQFWASD